MRHSRSIKLVRAGCVLAQFHLGNIVKWLNDWHGWLPPSKKVSILRGVQGIQHEVRIYRDQFSIPHIYAQNQRDLYFAQGYVHAQDRFWQMEFWRHLGAGRLSEMLGAETLATDTFVRTVGWNRMAEKLLVYYQEQAPEVLALLDSYCAGVNAWLEKKGHHFPLDMKLLRIVQDAWDIEPWTVLNSLTWGIVMADDLGENWRSERTRAELSRTLGETTVRRFLPRYPYEYRPVIAATSATEQSAGFPEFSMKQVQTNWRRVHPGENGDKSPESSVFGHGPGIGSGAWVVSGRYTANGYPLLANDTHLQAQIPSIWYEIGLHTPDSHVVGFSFAGMPGVVVGHNDTIAWAITNARLDEQDLYMEKINSHNPNQYAFQGQWCDMETVTEVIKVRGEEDRTLSVRQTRHGPIILDAVDGQHDALALQWTAFEPSRLLQAVLLLNQAQDYNAFREALRYWDTPAQNFLYADSKGNIAYQLAGRVPLRQHWDGFLPVAGWTGDYEWQGQIPYDDLPAILNPAEGYIVAANHAITNASYPHALSLEWDHGDRAQRITDLLRMYIAREKMTADHCIQMQMDDISLLAECFHSLFTRLSSRDPRICEALNYLQNWDCRLQQNSVAATLFELFRFHLAHVLLDDEIGSENVDHLATLSFFHQLVREPESHWWKNACERLAKSRSELLLQAMANTVDWCEQHLGGDMKQWVWGRIHTLTFVNTPVGHSANAYIRAMVNRGPFPVDGGGSVINAMGWDRKKPALVNNIPAMRMVVDLYDLNAGRAVNSTGQSEHPTSVHYDDLMRLWLQGQYHPMLFSQERVEQAAASLQVLRSAF